jgi:diguanylate cyclase (GGDEF)-like protein
MLGRGIALRDASGKAYRMAGSQTDITLGKVADALTGLPNRILFIDQLNRCLDRAKRYSNYSFGVIFLDLDGFKLVNDSLGHVMGDQLLVSISRRLELSLRAVDLVARLGVGHTVARLGGDEFIVLVDNIHTASDASTVAERIKAELSKPFVLRGQEIFTSASMGIALYSPGYEQPEDLIRDADTAMYRAKVRGKSCYEIFDSQMRASILARLQLETDLRGAVERQEFRPYYQPIVHLQTGRLESFEALVRWQHPARGLLLPVDFIETAEETGLIIDLEEYMLRESTRQVRLWQESYPTSTPLRIGINLSSKHFIKPNLKSKCLRILTESNLDPACLTLEITESTVVPHPDLATSTMNELKSVSIRISIDDFGTGYSSLSYLQRFPFDNLKIDRSFVSRMHSCPDSFEIVRTIVTLAHNLNLTVVAEGVETYEQVASLRQLGCEMAQGHFFSEPLAAAQASLLLSTPPAWEEKLLGRCALAQAGP